MRSISIIIFKKNAHTHTGIERERERERLCSWSLWC